MKTMGAIFLSILMLGCNQISGVSDFVFSGPEVNYLDDEEAARQVFERVLEWGGNVLRHRSGTLTPEYWREIVRLSNRHGVALFASLPFENPIPSEEREAMAAATTSGPICPVAFRDDYYIRLWTAGAEAGAKHGGIDQRHIMDEYNYACTCAKCKALFKERYGGELSADTDGDLKGRDWYWSVFFEHRMHRPWLLAQQHCKTVFGLLKAGAQCGNL